MVWLAEAGARTRPCARLHGAAARRSARQHAAIMAAALIPLAGMVGGGIDISAHVHHQDPAAARLRRRRAGRPQGDGRRHLVATSYHAAHAAPNSSSTPTSRPMPTAAPAPTTHLHRKCRQGHRHRVGRPADDADAHPRQDDRDARGHLRGRNAAAQHRRDVRARYHRIDGRHADRRHADQDGVAQGRR